MRADPKIALDATVVVTLTEEEATVLAHLLGYDPAVIVGTVTRKFTTAVLERVARDTRGQLETAVARIGAVRKYLNDPNSDRKESPCT
jgi:hypothetical protein